MKKLVIALGLIALAAVSAQAAKVKWSVTGVSPSGEDKTPEGYYMACFCDSVNWTETQGKYTPVASVDAWAKSKGASAEGINVLAEGALDDQGSGGNTSAYATLQNVWKNSSAAGTKAGDFYAVIFNAADIADATEYMVTTMGNLKFATSGTTTQTVALGAGTWTAIGGDVPEPTSGLLLLLGMAGLALRRKQA